MYKKDLMRDELIGLPVKIISSQDPTWDKKEGVVVDETKNTFKIKIDDKEKRIAKKIAVFEFIYDNKKIRINGKDIIYRPEDRIKKIR